jgi:acetoacetyl-CoA synthetase
MWNISQASLLAGATLVLYNGSPAFPEPDYLWKLASDAKLNHFGIGAAYLLGTMHVGHSLEKYNFNSLKTLGSTGSPLPAEGYEWAYENVKKELVLMSLSGGTEVSSGFVGGCVHLPVFAGEIQCRMLGCAIEIWNENRENVLDEMGELIITKPMPSMPVYFWNDPDFAKYKASYFEEYGTIWRHGDWAKITQNGGVIIYGRSDSTLNKNGIRIGTSEIYRVVEQIEGIFDSLILNIEYPDGSSWMPLFVKLKDGYMLNNELIANIKSAIKNQCSARHIPEEIIAVLDIPYTLSNKKVEVPIKKIFLGQNPEKAVNFGALRNPEAVEEYLKIYEIKLNKI